MANIDELKSTGLKATLPRLKILDVFHKGALRHMTAEDVLHSFYVPAFRVKKDAVSGRYTELWFQPTQAGTFQLFCTEYCGKGHSDMLGKIVVEDEAGYQRWLKEGDEQLFPDVHFGVAR